MNISKHFTNQFRLKFTLIKAHKMQNNIPTVHISEIHCYVVKSNNLSTIVLRVVHIIKIKIIVLPWQNWRKREPAFSVNQLLILHVIPIFGKYEGVASCMYF
jgi:hypothetical protein